MASRVSFSVRPLALPISIKWILFISWAGKKLINNFFPYKPSAMAGRVSFSVRPPASPTYPIHLINLYEQPRTWSTIFDNTKRPFFRHYPFPWKHSQKPIAYTFAYALVALPTNSILSIHTKKKKKHFFPDKLSAMTICLSFSVHPPAPPTYQILPLFSELGRKK